MSCYSISLMFGVSIDTLVDENNVKFWCSVWMQICHVRSFLLIPFWNVRELTARKAYLGEQRSLYEPAFQDALSLIPWTMWGTNPQPLICLQWPSFSVPWPQGDTCASIAKLFNIKSLKGTGSPNPFLDCSELTPGQRVGLCMQPSYLIPSLFSAPLHIFLIYRSALLLAPPLMFQLALHPTS
jgi:hypothetical protein